MLDLIQTYLILEEAMIIGVPKEIMPGERRVSATPETVKAMRDMGLTVLVQKDAGEGAYFTILNT